MVDILIRYPQAMDQSRILLKDAYYILQMLVDCQDEQSSNQPLVEKVNSLQELFGDWHDWEVALAHFDAYLDITQGDLD